MADPVLIAIPKNIWTKVATNVQRGQVSIVGNSPSQILSTYRTSGNAAPTGTTEGLRFSRKSIQIRSKTFIDVYIRAEDKDGEVRVDI